MYKIVSKLLMYGDMPKDSILMQLSDIFKQMDQDTQSRDELVTRIFTQVKHLLQVATDYGFDKNLWHNYLTYLLITHDLNAVKYISDKIAVMYLGKLVEFGSTEEVTEQPRHPYTKGLMKAAPILDPRMRDRKKEIIDGEPGSMMDLGTGCRFYARCRYASLECQSHDPQMDLMETGHQVACHHPLK